jgi:hypothetical protein
MEHQASLAPLTSMRDLLQQTVFTVGEDAYCWADIAIASIVWGDWDLLRQEVRQGMSCLRAIRESGRPMPEAEIERAAADFRYERELISADEAEAWFARWGLSAGAWMEFIRRSVSRRTHESRLSEWLARYPVDDAEIAAAMRVEAVCSGLLTRLAPKFAARAAVYARMHAARENGHPLFSDEELAGAMPPPPVELRARGLDLDEAYLTARSARVAEIELALRDFRGEVVTPKTVGEQIAAHHLEWIRVDYQTLIYPAESMAREALLCVREDGMEFLELASESEAAELRDEEHWIGEVTGPLHASLLGALPGEVLGPFSTAAGHALLRITNKRLPTAEDEQVRTRAEMAALRRALANELQTRVQWIAEL